MDDVLVRAVYNGSTWDVWVIDDVNLSELQSSPVDTEGFVQTSDGSGGFSHVSDVTFNSTNGFLFGNNPDIEAVSFVVGTSNEADSTIIALGSANVFETGISGQVFGDSNEIAGDDSKTIVGQ